MSLFNFLIDEQEWMWESAFIFFGVWEVDWNDLDGAGLQNGLG